MRKYKRYETPYGKVEITQTNAQRTSIKSETNLGAYYGQGIATAQLRLWQLELTRRIAQGRLSEIFGSSTIEADRFQRKLQLEYLAKRDYDAETDRFQQQALIAYTEGINDAIKQRSLLPPEFYILGIKPTPFHPVDCYTIAHLKYFINTIWKSRIVQTRLAQRLPHDVYQHLFSHVSTDEVLQTSSQEHIAWLYRHVAEVIPALEALGLESIDTGSSCFALNQGEKTWLAFEPHMGHVTPAFTLFFELRSEQGLHLFGGNMPGNPGIIFGRNQYVAWGMTGIMADNQELYIVDEGKLSDPVQSSSVEIKIKSATSQTVEVARFAAGHRLFNDKKIGAYLYWPALDHGVGDIIFHRLNKAKDVRAFKTALQHYALSPMMFVYAGVDGSVGSQLAGRLPQKVDDNIAIVKNWHDETTHWVGYMTQEALPSQWQAKEGRVIEANQRLHGKTPEKIATRWHPPTRYNRITFLLQQYQTFTIDDFSTIQHDQFDSFAAKFIKQYQTWFLKHNDIGTLLSNYEGNTQQTNAARCFDRFIYELAFKSLQTWLDRDLVAQYYEQWPSFRWSVVNYFESLPVQTQSKLFDQSIETIKDKCSKKEFIIYRHAFSKHRLLGALFNRSYRHRGGNRETIYVERSNSDFLSDSQSVTASQAGYLFGPSCHLVFELHSSKIHYLNSTANNESILSLHYWIGFYRRWQRKRYKDLFS